MPIAGDTTVDTAMPPKKAPPKKAPLEVDYSSISNIEDAAQRMKVPLRAIPLVTIRKKGNGQILMCRTKGCIYPAIHANYKWCANCYQLWYPRTTDANGDPATPRGWGLYGQQFLARPGGRSSAANSCCCGSSLCISIGYSNHGNFRLPKNYQDFITATRVLGISHDVRQAMWKEKNPRKFYVAPWHYHRKHMGRDSDDGSWSLHQFQKGKKYYDEEGVAYDFPPPNANVQKFIDEVIPPFDPHAPLPEWIKVYAKYQMEHESSVSGRKRKSDTKTSQSKAGKRGKATSGMAPTTARVNLGRRRSAISEELEDVKEDLRLKEAMLMDARKHIDLLQAKIGAMEDHQKVCQDEHISMMQQASGALDLLKGKFTKNRYYSYDDLKPGGRLENLVSDFTFFDDFDSNDEFL